MAGEEVWREAGASRCGVWICVRELGAAMEDFDGGAVTALCLPSGCAVLGELQEPGGGTAAGVRRETQLKGGWP